jgi:hypothetical protein
MTATRSASIALLAVLGTCISCTDEPPPPSGPPVRVAAVGDIACAEPPSTAGTDCRYDVVARAAIEADPEAFLVLGDVQYASASGQVDYARYDRFFGSLRDRSIPTPGDEDWEVGRAAFLDYFGDRTTESGTGSLALGSWHLVVLNSRDCFDDDGCGPGTPQYEWLEASLSDPPDGTGSCTMAIWHDPRFLWANWWQKDGVPRGGQERVAPFWELLDAAGVDVVLHGNVHHYERWASMDAAGNTVTDGITQFIVGTGGKSLVPTGPEPRPEALEVAQATEFGVLTMLLRGDRLDYRWQGAEPGGSFSDEGTVPCH